MKKFDGLQKVSWEIGEQKEGPDGTVYQFMLTKDAPRDSIVWTTIGMIVKGPKTLEELMGYGIVAAHATAPYCLVWVGDLTGIKSAPAAPKGAWNDKCPSCGRGIYVGFLKTEHEGGACPRT